MENQTQETKKMNIYEKMSCITNEITRVAKNLSVGVGKSSYKAVGEADVLAAIKPIEEKYGVYSYPCSRNIVEANVLTSTSTYNGEVTEKNSMFLRVETTYRFVNINNPSEYIDVVTYGDGVDSQDKAPGKAMTYADKYALLKAYKIETGDDPDQHKSEEFKSIQNSASTPITEEQIKILEGLDQAVKQTICEKEKVDSIKKITMFNASKWIKYCQSKNLCK